AKPGTLFELGRSFAGEVQVADIGLGLDDPSSAGQMLDKAAVARALPRRASDTHKRSAGVTLIVAGSRAMPGAAALAAGACVGAGSGLTTLLSVEEACLAAASRVPEITTLPFASSEGVL